MIELSVSTIYPWRLGLAQNPIPTATQLMFLVNRLQLEVVQGPSHKSPHQQKLCYYPRGSQIMKTIIHLNFRGLEFSSQKPRKKASQILYHTDSNSVYVFSNVQNFVFLFFISFFSYPREFLPLKKNHFTVLSGGFMEKIKSDSWVYLTILNFL